MGPCNRQNALSWLWGVKKRQMMLLNFLIIFYYLMLNQIFRDVPPRFFAYCTSSMKITIWIPLAKLSFDQAVYITFEQNCVHSPKQHEFQHVYICFWYTFLSQKVNLTKGQNSLTSYLHHKRRDPSEVAWHSPIFDSLTRTRNINYNI